MIQFTIDEFSTVAVDLFRWNFYCIAAWNTVVRKIHRKINPTRNYFNCRVILKLFGPFIFPRVSNLSLIFYIFLVASGNHGLQLSESTRILESVMESSCVKCNGFASNCHNLSQNCHNTSRSVTICHNISLNGSNVSNHLDASQMWHFNVRSHAGAELLWRSWQKKNKRKTQRNWFFCSSWIYFAIQVLQKLSNVHGIQ